MPEPKILYAEKADLRREIRSRLENTADTIKNKSTLIRNRLMTIAPFQRARKTGRLMSFVSMPLEIDTLPFLMDSSMIVPYCEADEIVPVRIFSLDELEPAGKLKIFEPKLYCRQDVSRHILPEQIDVILVPGLAFDSFGNRLGRGKGYYDRFLRRLCTHTLTIGLALEEMIRHRIPCGTNDCPVKMVVTESRSFSARCIPAAATDGY